MSLYVVYTPDTGHVLGAVTMLGGTPPGEAAGTLVGDELPMRVSLGNGEMAVLPVPARQLAVLAAEDEPRVFADPLAFGVELVPDVGPKPALVRLGTWPAELTFAADRLVVTVPVANASRPTKVLAWVSEGEDTHVLAGEIPAEKDAVELPVTVASGPHGVLVLVAGWAGSLQAVTKP
jgi:hypothetical protein